MPFTHVRYDDVEQSPGYCGAVRELIDPANAGARLVSTAAIEVEVGRASEPHSHAKTEEIYFILEGEGVVTIDGETFSAMRWDSIHIPPGVVHSIKNTGSTPLQLLAINGPAYSPDDLVPAPTAGAQP